MYVGIENLFRRDLNPALDDLGVGASGTGVAVPLRSFNLGVELGQLSIAGFGLPIIAVTDRL